MGLVVLKETAFTLHYELTGTQDVPSKWLVFISHVLTMDACYVRARTRDKGIFW